MSSASRWMLDGWFGLSGVCLVATVKGNSWSGWCDRGWICQIAPGFLDMWGKARPWQAWCSLHVQDRKEELLMTACHNIFFFWVLVLIDLVGTYLANRMVKGTILYHYKFTDCSALTNWSFLLLHRERWWWVVTVGFELAFDSWWISQRSGLLMLEVSFLSL